MIQIINESNKNPWGFSQYYLCGNPQFFDAIFQELVGK